MLRQQLYDAVVHDGLRQHLELEQPADELDVAQQAPVGLVLRLLQRVLQLLFLALDPREREREAALGTPPELTGGICSVPRS